MDPRQVSNTPLQRRSLLVAGILLLAPNLATAAAPAGRRLAFAVFRNGSRVGDHLMSFAGEAGSQVVTTEVTMAIKLGPVPVFRYRHRAVERWRGGRFASLDTTTEAGGRKQTVAARRGEAGVSIETGKGRVMAPAAALPLTHWNPEALSGPLFNPQEGKLVKVTARRLGRETVKLASGQGVEAVRWFLRGEADIDNWYDAAGVWTALSGKLPDGSTLEYRRL